MTTFTTTECIEARLWDSEKRNSPYSTVCDPNAEYCEICEADYAADGTCNCEESHEETDEEYAAAMAALGYKIKGV